MCKERVASKDLLRSLPLIAGTIAAVYFVVCYPPDSKEFINSAYFCAFMASVLTLIEVGRMVQAIFNNRPPKPAK